MIWIWSVFAIKNEFIICFRNYLADEPMADQQQDGRRLVGTQQQDDEECSFLVFDWIKNLREGARSFIDWWLFVAFSKDKPSFVRV